MVAHIHLASGSAIRADLMRRAGINLTARGVDIDERSIEARVVREGEGADKGAMLLAREKARKAALAQGGYVIGADQVLECDGALLSKVSGYDEAVAQLQTLSGRSHQLFSAAAIVRDGEVLFAYCASVTLTMRRLTDDYIARYLDRNWHSVQDAVGCYKLEEEGVRLFSEIDGDYFTVLGLPLLPIVKFFVDEGVIDG